MPSLFFGMVANASPPADENTVRRSTWPVDDASPATVDHDPDWNEVTVDGDPNLGIVNRSVSGDHNPSEQYAAWWASGAQHRGSDGIKEVNDQISSSGTAAAREAAGIQGHGTMEHSVSIEPVIRDGGALSNEYFEAIKPPVQDVAQNEVSSVSDRGEQSGALAALGMRSTGAAFGAGASGSLYDALLG